jgi:hypothetical protein
MKAINNKIETPVTSFVTYTAVNENIINLKLLIATILKSILANNWYVLCKRAVKGGCAAEVCSK